MYKFRFSPLNLKKKKKKKRVECSLRLGFKASNNEAKYEALIVGLRAVLDLGA